MTISSSLSFILEDYKSAYQQVFTEHYLANLIRADIPKSLSKLLNNDRYIVEGSPGKGNWAHIPWIAIFDRSITTSAQDGYYVVYLFKEDMSGVYLSLNQGVTVIQNKDRKNAKKRLTASANNFRSQLGLIPKRFTSGEVNLGNVTKKKLGGDYECGSICEILYKKENLPDEQTLENDLNTFLAFYQNLANSDNQSYSDSIKELDEIAFEEENLAKIRFHKRIERNQKLVKKVKASKGYVCEACGFDFEAVYGEIGRNYIEAHHLQPLHTIHEDKVTLDPKNDFAVLCSNCHRMIHKSNYVSDVQMFRKRHIAKES